LARLYTSEEIQDALRELRIDPVDGNVTTKEAADILTWRARKDGINHNYPETAIRSRVKRGTLKAASTGWSNLYRVEDIFRLSFYPKRGAQSNSSEEATQQAR